MASSNARPKTVAISPGPCSIRCSKRASTAVSFRPSVRASPWLVSQLHGISGWTAPARACPGRGEQRQRKTNFQTSGYGTRSKTRRKTRTLSTGSRCVSTALSERGPPAWPRPLEEGAVVDAAFDDRMRGAGHLCGDRRERLAAKIGVVPVPRDVALELGSEAVVALADRDLPGHPQRAAQSCVAELGELRLAAELTGLLGR